MEYKSYEEYLALQEAEKQRIEEERLERQVQEKIRTNRLMDLVFLIPAAVLMLLYLLKIVFLGTFYLKFFFYATWVSMLVLSIMSKRKNYFALMLIVNFIVAVFLMSMMIFPDGFRSYSPWRYKFQKAYMGEFTKESIDFCPDELPDDISDYKIEYTPPFMQGAGYFSLRFKTDAEHIAKYKEEYTEKAAYIYTLNNYLNISEQDDAENTTVTTTEVSRPYVSIGYDRGFWTGHGENAEIHLLEFKDDITHEYSCSVIIDQEDCMVEFSKFRG